MIRKIKDWYKNLVINNTFIGVCLAVYILLISVFMMFGDGAVFFSKTLFWRPFYFIVEEFGDLIPYSILLMICPTEFVQRICWTVIIFKIFKTLHVLGLFLDVHNTRDYLLTINSFTWIVVLVSILLIGLLVVVILKVFKK